MNNDNDSNTSVTQDTAGAAVQLGDAPNLLAAAANDPVQASESNVQAGGDSKVEPEPETPAHPGTDLYARLEALEKHFSDLIVAVKRDVLAMKDGSGGEFEKIGEEVKTVGASFASHVHNLIQAGIHKAEDFFHLLYPHSTPATIVEAPTPVADSVNVVGDPVSVTSNAAAAGADEGQTLPPADQAADAAPAAPEEGSPAAAV